jgi:hypothetical protein
MGPFGNRAQALLANDDYTRDTNGKFSETQGGGAAKQDPDPPTTDTQPDFSQPASLSPDQAADYLSKNPNSPHADAMSLWAEDAEPFSELIKGDDERSKAWRSKCADTINAIKPDTSGATVHRGWQFKTKEQRDHVLNQVLSKEGFTNTRPGMSASYDSKVSQRDKFIGKENNGLGMVWEIKKPSTVRDFSGVFEKMRSSSKDEREAIFPGGSRFRIKAGTKPSMRRRADGRQYTHVQVEEITTKKR